MSDFSDLLVKIAQNKNLTPSELADLERFGRETQSRNAFVGGNTTAHGSLAVPTPFFPIYSEVLQVDTASLTINIPGGYKHLMIMGQSRSTEAAYANVLRARFNGDTGTNYREQYHGGQNASASIGAFTAQAYFSIGDVNGTSATTGAAGGYVVFIPHYTNNVFWKNAMSIRGIPLVNASSEDLNILLSAFWQSTAKIETMTFFPAAGNILAGSIISVYGIL